jgi:hypothetical protein
MNIVIQNLWLIHWRDAQAWWSGFIKTNNRYHEAQMRSLSTQAREQLLQSNGIVSTVRTSEVIVSFTLTYEFDTVSLNEILALWLRMVIMSRTRYVTSTASWTTPPRVSAIHLENYFSVQWRKAFECCAIAPSKAQWWLRRSCDAHTLSVGVAVFLSPAAA